MIDDENELAHKFSCAFRLIIKQVGMNVNATSHSKSAEFVQKIQQASIQLPVLTKGNTRAPTVFTGRSLHFYTPEQFFLYN